MGSPFPGTYSGADTGDHSKSVLYSKIWFHPFPNIHEENHQVCLIWRKVLVPAQKKREHLWFVKITSVFATQLPLWLYTPWGVNTMSVSISTHSTGRELYRKWQISDVLSKCSFKRLYWPSQMASIYALISEMEINSISCLEYHARYWGCRGNGSKTDKILSGLAQSSQERSSTNNKRTCGSYGLPW